MSKITKYALSDLYDMSSGLSSKKEQAGHGAPFVSFGTVFNNYFLPEELPDLMDTNEKEQQIYSIKTGDVLITRTSETIDELAMSCVAVKDYPKATYSGFTKRLRPKREGIAYPKYMAFYFRSALFRKAVTNNAFMTLRASFNEDIFTFLDVYLPDYDEQVRIGDMLYNIECKIQKNKEINDYLEEMAKTIYDYWFVQFDFPNEEGKPYKSSGGEMVWNEKLKRDIPASWKTKAIEDIADVYNGATPSTVNEQNYGGDIVWITPKDLSDQKQKFVYQGERNISQAGYNSCSTHLLPPNTILMSSRAPIGLLSIAKTELCTNQGFKSFVPQAENISTYLYYYLNIHIKQIEQLGTGTTFKEVSREDVLKFPILKPSDAILDLWEKQVSALNNKQFVIQKENEFLTKQRDELLPLLMNGQVSVNSDLSNGL